MTGRIFKVASVLVLISALAVPAMAQFTNAKRRPDPGPMPKNVHGLIQDAAGNPLPNARVFIKDLKSNVIRTLTTDKDGLYSIFALPPTVDYEIYCEYKGTTSEKRVISSFLNRQDNVLNFQLDVSAAQAPPAANNEGPVFNSFDLVRLRASFDMPTGVPAPIPAVLLIHGYGEDRTVWNSLKKDLLTKGWAVMALDLRGHGESTTRNSLPLQRAESWRTSPREFPLDVDPALDWLKSQPRLNNNRIAVIGFDIGADLALISGKFPEVSTVVAIKPKLSESLAMAGSSQDFTPRSALILTPDEAEGNRIKPRVQEPVKVETVEVTGGTTAWISNPQVVSAILDWLQQTF